MSALSALNWFRGAWGTTNFGEFPHQDEQGSCFGWWAVRPDDFWALWRALWCLPESRLKASPWVLHTQPVASAVTSKV